MSSLLLPTVRTCCTLPLGRFLVLGRVAPQRYLQSSTAFFQKSKHLTNANKSLLKALDTELKFASKEFYQLPEVTAFDSSIDGAIATFTRTQANEKIAVTLDINSSVELDSMGGDFEAEETEEDEEASCIVPAFTVVITKPSGNQLQFECSFGVEYSDVEDSETLKWNIDSVSAVPKDCKRVESLYSVQADQLGEELYDGLEAYLAERGVDHSFGMQLHSFFSTFERRTYVTNFLELVKKYCSEQ